MTKKQLADQVAQEAAITEQLAKRIVQTVFDCMASALVSGETLEFRDFGVFKTRVRKARTARNPRAGNGCPGAGTQGDCLEDGERVEGENPCFINTSKTRLNLYCPEAG